LQKVSEPLRDAPDFFSAMAMGSEAKNTLQEARIIEKSWKR
jgi:hypothetical protein